MDSTNLVSIITPSYNSSKFIRETIQSIQEQTYQNWELLITDDCSSDDCCKIIEDFVKKDPRIKLLHLKQNSGAGIARNNSIEYASGRYIAFCDSDDKWFPTKLEKQIEFMKANSLTLSYTSYMTCDENGINTGIVVCRNRETLSSMCKDDKMGFSTVIYDTKAVGKVFLPTMRKRQDWALKLKILKLSNSAGGLKEPLAYYRIRHNSISRNKLSLIKYNIQVLREIMEWSSLRAHVYFYLVFLPTHLKKLLFLRYLNK